MNGSLLHRFWRDCRAATAAEFVVVLPLFLLLVFGMIDVAGYAWRMNMAQKATQYGARLAVVTNPVAQNLSTQEYVGQTYGGVTLNQGDVIPASALGLITCDSTGCTQQNSTDLPNPPGYDADAFDRILTRMQGIEPAITAGNLVVEYRGSGVGYAGDPGGMQIAPLVTVRLQDMTYSPWMGLIYSGGIGLPNVSYTLSMEDGEGTVSN